VVIFIIGLSGAGKTTVGKALVANLRLKNSNVVFLDGDELRQVYGNVFGYTFEQRKLAGETTVRMCKLLSDQGIIVVCSVIGMLKEIRDYNRANNTIYKEIYLKVPLEVLKTRKDIYDKYLKNQITNVVGMDVNAEYPENPDLVIENYGKISAKECVDKIMDLIKRDIQ